MARPQSISHRAQDSFGRLHCSMWRPWWCELGKGGWPKINTSWYTHNKFPIFVVKPLRNKLIEYEDLDLLELFSGQAVLTDTFSANLKQVPLTLMFRTVALRCAKGRPTYERSTPSKLPTCWRKPSNLPLAQAVVRHWRPWELKWHFGDARIFVRLARYTKTIRKKPAFCRCSL